MQKSLDAKPAEIPPPSTIAAGQNTGESRPVQGTQAYIAYFEALWEERMTYAEFLKALHRPSK